VPLLSHLRRRGLRVAVPAFGLCSYVAVYCGEDVIPETARAIVEVRGVDFACYNDGGEVVVESERGTARIAREGMNYRYRIVSGDVLELASLGQGTNSDAWWFGRTAAHHYPDAVANIYKSVFAARVQHPADILVSLKDGYYYGWSPFGRLVTLAATHGNALQASSNAFLMSTHRQFPAFVRADEARSWLRG